MKTLSIEQMEQVNAGGMSCTEAGIWLGVAIVASGAAASTGLGFLFAVSSLTAAVRGVMTCG